MYPINFLYVNVCCPFVSSSSWCHDRYASLTSSKLHLKGWGFSFKTRTAVHPSRLRFTVFLNFPLLSLIPTLCKTLLQDGCHIKYSSTGIEDGDFFQVSHLPLILVWILLVTVIQKEGTFHSTTVSSNFQIISISIGPFLDIFLVKEDWPLVTCQWKRLNGLLKKKKKKSWTQPEKTQFLQFVELLNYAEIINHSKHEK